MNNFLSKVRLPSLDILDLEILNEPISVTVAEKPIEATKVNKALGPDGNTAEFYKQYKDVLSKKLQNVFLRCIESKTLPSCWTKGNIVLILRLDKDLTQVQSYRPIIY